MHIIYTRMCICMYAFICMLVLRHLYAASIPPLSHLRHMRRRRLKLLGRFAHAVRCIRHMRRLPPPAFVVMAGEFFGWIRKRWIIQTSVTCLTERRSSSNGGSWEGKREEGGVTRPQASCKEHSHPPVLQWFDSRMIHIVSMAHLGGGVVRNEINTLLL